MPATRHRPTLLALLTAWVGMLVFAAHLLMRAEIHHHEQSFDEEIRQLSASIKSKLDTNETVLSGFSAFLQAVDRSDTESTQRYAAAIASAYPHIYMIEVARKVALIDQQNLESSLRRGWRPDFTLKRFSELTQRTDNEQIRKPDTWPILFMHPVLPEAEAVYGVRLETVDYLSHTLARSQGNAHAVTSPIFKLYEGGEAYILLKEVVRHSRTPEDASLNFFGNTMVAMLVIKTEALIPPPSPGKENSQINFSAEFAANGGLLFSQSTAEGSLLDRLMLPRFKRVQHIANSSQAIVATYAYQLRWADLLNNQTTVIFCLLFCGFILAPWLTVRHYKRICETEIAHEKSAYLATHDLLTGLPNRFLFNDRLNQAALNWQRNGSHFAVMLIDLDHFKEINDNFGHETGDQVLCEAAKRMTQELRSFDTVARYGGDEFIVLLTNIIDLEDTRLVGEKILSAVSRPITTSAGKLSISCSIGIAICPSHGKDPDTLRRQADVAMYEAKQGGRNAVSFAHLLSVD
jgi:diguanylate cyclase (GGDEF)-like protein